MALKHIVPGARYINLKKGTVYQVFQFGHHSEDETGHAIYLAVEPSDNRKQLSHAIGLWLLRLALRFLDRDTRTWVRPIEIFEEKFRER